MEPVCDLILPCRDEAAALRGLLPAVPAAFAVIVVDNGSTRRHRRRGAPARRPRRRRAVARATARPCTPGWSPPPVSTSRSWTATAPSTRASCCRCWPTCGPAAPTSPSAGGVRWRAGCGRGTRAPATGSGRQLLRRRRLPGPRHRTDPGLPSLRPPGPGRRGPEVRLPGGADAEGHARRLADRRARRLLPPPRRRDPLQGVRLGPGHAPDGARLLAGARDEPRPHCLVVAKAPVPGLAKTRLGAEVGMAAAADLAAAALLDTLDACARAFATGRRHVALTGDLGRRRTGPRDRRTAARLVGVRAGRRRRFADAAGRRARRGGPAYRCARRCRSAWTPRRSPTALLRAVAAGLDDHDAVLGAAHDGGWWVLALRDPADAAVLADVPTSTPDTGARTREALQERGLAVGDAPRLRDVDTVEDAAGGRGRGAGHAGSPRPGRAWTQVGVMTAAPTAELRVRPRLRRGPARRRLPPGRARRRPGAAAGRALAREADAADRALLAHCVGHTLDVGCGPGRMSAHLMARGPRRARHRPRRRRRSGRPGERGVAALRRDVFAPLPGEGRWDTRPARRRQHRYRRRPAGPARPRRRAARARRPGRRRPRAARGRRRDPPPRHPHARSGTTPPVPLGGGRGRRDRTRWPAAVGLAGLRGAPAGRGRWFAVLERR